MKKYVSPVTRVSYNAEKVPMIQDFSFVPSEPITREEWVNQQAHENFVNTCRDTAVVGIASTAGFALCKGLTALGKMTGKRGFHAAAALTGCGTAIAGFLASKMVMERGLDRDFELHYHSNGLPAVMRNWSLVDTKESQEIMDQLEGLEYKVAEDGPVTVEELQAKRTTQVMEVLREAKMDIGRSQVLSLIENEQFEVVENLVATAKTLIAERAETEAWKKRASVAETAISPSEDAPVEPRDEPSEEPEW